MVETSEIKKEFESIIGDKEHGSSFILKKTLDLLNKTKKEDRITILSKIARAHPSMAGISNLYSFLTEKERQIELEEIIEIFNKMENNTISNLINIVSGKKVVAISRSHITEKGLLTAKKVFVLISNPGGEGKETCKFLEKHGIETELYEDSEVCAALKESDLVVVGADIVNHTGFVNKVGTLPLAICSKFLKKSFSWLLHLIRSVESMW